MAMMPVPGWDVPNDYYAPDEEDDEARANARLAHLTGICPRCGDAGWWMDDIGCEAGSCFHYCSCPAGIKAHFEDEGGGD